jgi:GT2 family glycosyltransferase
VNSLTVAIPTFGREVVLIETIEYMLSLQPSPDELLIIDQTVEHEPATTARLNELQRQGSIRLLPQLPSIPKAMNRALREAENDLVLFVDDDVVPLPELIKVHQEAHRADSSLWATVGQIIQPWQTSSQLEPPRVLGGLRADFDFPFHSTVHADVQNVMAGNLCVNRHRALAIGGFDEMFVGAAYRFETEFAKRIIQAGGRIRFLGSAGLFHLKATTGGTRSTGSHLTSASPSHSFGDYYYAFRHGSVGEAWRYSGRRIFREISTRFHLRNPWWIPVKLVGELRGLIAGYHAARLRHKSIGDIKKRV